MIKCTECIAYATRYAVLLIWAKGHQKYSHDAAECSVGGYCDGHEPQHDLLQEALKKFDELAEAIGRMPHGVTEIIWLTPDQYHSRFPEMRK